MKRYSYIIVTALMLLYIALVFFLCLYDFDSKTIMVDLNQYLFSVRLDRYIHFLMFFPYPFIAWLFLNYNKHNIVYRQYTFSFIIISGLLLASLAEASQEMFTIYRDTDPFDFASNLSGILVATMVLYILRKPLLRLSLKVHSL